MNLLFAATFALFCSDAFAASKCGKPSLKIKYGKSKVFTSPNIESGTCKYRLKVGTGLSIKFTLREYSTDHSLTVFDGTAKRFNARKAKRFPVPSPPQPSGKVLQFDTHSIVMELSISTDSTPTSFTYEAVLPADGNFGYDIQARAKANTIVTPGFPKFKLPSGIQSTWNIRCGENEVISLSFIGLAMASDTDYVEVHDGDVLLGRHSGKIDKHNPVEHIARSGSMRITLRTTSSQSSGFKAKYSALKVNTTTISTSGLICHKRDRVMSKTVTLSDSHSSMTCGSNEVCGRMVMEGKPSNERNFFPMMEETFSSMTITSETMSCIPRDLCSGPADACSITPPSSEVTVNSCAVTCCDTNLCNRSPDGPDVPSSPVPGASVLRCNYESEIQVEGGPNQGSGSDGVACPHGGVCGLFVFKGNSCEGNAVSGYASNCVPQTDCNREGCSSHSATKDLNITSCEATCCNTDMCNQRDTAATTPSREPASGGVRRCYDITSSIVGTITVIDKKETMVCDDPEAECMRLDSAGTDSLGNKMTMVSGRCVPAVSCGAINCWRMVPPIPGVNMTSCNAGCCSTNLCNGEELTSSAEPVSRLPPTLPSVESGSSIQCHEGTEIRGLGGALPGTSRSVRQCAIGSKCMAIKATATHSSLSGIQLAINYGACMDIALCENVDCDSLPTLMPGVTIGSCDVSCCDSDLCNA